MKKASILKQEIFCGSKDEILIKLYGKDRLKQQKNRYIEALERFIQLYGDEEAEIYSAPGRSEICGNHTDHQQGKVLAAAINLDILCVAGKTNENKVFIQSDDYTVDPISMDDLDKREKEQGTTESLVRGMAAGLSKEGYHLGGICAYMTSEVLRGSGLSSSAAFETMIGTMISGLYNGGTVDAVKIAQIGQYAENEYFGKPSGLMDQMASSVGGFIRIDFADSSHPDIRKVETDIHALGYQLCIVDTKGSHADLTDEYAAIQIEMKEVAKFFGKQVLREVDVEEFYAKIPKIREKLGDRPVLRAIHFFEENVRVEKGMQALLDNDMDTFLKVIQESGDSSYKYLQNVYAKGESRHQEMALALAVSANRTKEICRVHGGGFAGTIQAFVKKQDVERYKQEMEKIFGTCCYILDIRLVGGIQVMG